MYIDLVVLVVLILVVIMYFRRFSSFVYFIGIVDIFLRILTFIKNNIGLPDLAAVIDNYIPESILAIAGNYTDGILYTVIAWAYIVIMAIFLFYNTKFFIKKKKI